MQNENCNNVTKLCHDFGNDFQEALKLNEQYPHQLLFLRYENLCLHPYDTLDNVLSFLNLPPKSIVEKYLASRIGVFRNGSNAKRLIYKSVSRTNIFKTKR